MKLQLPITPCVVNNEDHEKTQFFMNIKYIYIYMTFYSTLKI